MYDREFFRGSYTYDKDGKLIPQLASDMPEVSDDETVYTVKMIKSQWSNGEEVTANDFVYSWNRAADEKQQLIMRICLILLQEMMTAHLL